MPDKIQIANLALGYLGVQPVPSFEAGTTQAILAGSFYEQAVQALLADHPWNFAERVERLARDAAAFRPDYGFSYQLPLNCVAPRWLMDPEGAAGGASTPTAVTVDVAAGHRGHGRGWGRHRDPRSRHPYKISGRKLCTDEPAAILVYTSRPPEQEFHPLFVEALAYLLAHKLAGPLTEQQERVEAHWRLYQAALGTARSRESQEDDNPRIETDALTAFHRD